ncbi:MAG: hypothetical protein AAFN41_01870 [Planctomycetota bacterium]
MNPRRFFFELLQRCRSRFDQRWQQREFRFVLRDGGSAGCDRSLKLDRFLKCLLGSSSFDLRSAERGVGIGEFGFSNLQTDLRILGDHAGHDLTTFDEVAFKGID